MRELGQTGTRLTPWGIWKGPEAIREVDLVVVRESNWCDVPVKLRAEEWSIICDATREGRPGFVAARVDLSDWGRAMEERCREFCGRCGIEAIDLLQLGEFDLERIKAGEPFRRMQQVRDADLARRFGLYVTTLKEASWVIEHAPVVAMTVNAPLTSEEWKELTSAAAGAEMGILATPNAFSRQRRLAESAMERWPITAIGWTV